MGVPTEKPNTACKDERMTCQKKEDLKKGIGTYVIKKIQGESSLNTVNVTSLILFYSMVVQNFLSRFILT